MTYSALSVYFGNNTSKIYANKPQMIPKYDTFAEEKQFNVLH